MVGDGHGAQATVGRTTRAMAGLAAALLVTAGLVLADGGARASAASVSKACKSLTGLQSDLSDISPDISADSFDQGAFKKIGAAFTKAAKSAPKSVKASLNQLGKLYRSISSADNAVDAGLQLSKSAQKYSKAVRKFATFYATKCAGSTSGSTGSSSSGSSAAGGTLELAGETISLSSSRCYLQKQTSAGQDIDLTAQASGTTSDGDDVLVDFTRYAKGSSFEGDDISISVGGIGASDAKSYHGRLDLGEVERSGDTFSVDGAEMRDQDTGESVTMSFEIEC